MGTTFHVVIERPREVGPAGIAALADAMARHYGIPGDQLRERLAAGSLRVKSNVDRPTAEAFARDLESIGAVCAILDAATGEPVVAPRPAPRPAPKPSASPLAGIAAPSRPSAPPSPFASGLSAAGVALPAPDLGALNVDSGEFSLSMLDGADDQAAEPAARPSDAFVPASFGPAAPVEPEAAPAAAPVDPFAPPDAEKELLLDLDVDPATIRRSGQVSTSPVPAAPLPAAPEPEAPPQRTPGVAGLVADRRIRLGAGVALAILIGFLPAHLVAAIREDSAHAQVDREIEARYKSTVTVEDWEALDPMLARQLERKKDQRRSIALASFLIWGLVGGGVAFVWFRKLDWDAIVARVTRPS